MEKEESIDLVSALQSQIAANAERLRRTRKMVAVISEHLDSPIESAKRRRRRPIK